MAKGCFCHFNGYEVKDAKARRDIQGLQNDVDRLNDDLPQKANQSDLNETRLIAEGRARSFVFETYQDMFNALESDNGTTYKLGDNLFIKALNVPDYWVSGVLSVSSGEMGHYNVSMLETQKVDLSGYTPINDHNTLWDNVSDLETNIEELQENKSSVVANPSTDSNTSSLTSIKINNIPYKISAEPLYYHFSELTFKYTDTNNVNHIFKNDVRIISKKSKYDSNSAIYYACSNRGCYFNNFYPTIIKIGEDLYSVKEKMLNNANSIELTLTNINTSETQTVTAVFLGASNTSPEGTL